MKWLARAVLVLAVVVVAWAAFVVVMDVFARPAVPIINCGTGAAVNGKCPDMPSPLNVAPIALVAHSSGLRARPADS